MEGKMETIDNSKKKKYDDRCRMAVSVIANYPDYIKLIKHKYLTDDVLEDALDLNPDIFRYIKDPSMRVVIKALDIDASNIQYIDPDLVYNIPEEVLLNVIDNIDANLDLDMDFGKISEESRIDIFMQNPVKALKYGIQVPECFITKMLEEQPNLIKLIKNPSNMMKCIALEHEPNVAVYFDKLTDEMMDIIDKKYPYMKDSLSTYTRG